MAAGAQAAIAHLKDSNVERMQQRDRVALVRRRLAAAGIPTLDNPSHIVPVMVGRSVRCKAMSDMLLEDFGIYVQPINYPTVPRGTERLRITPLPMHTDADVDHPRRFTEGGVDGGLIPPAHRKKGADGPPFFWLFPLVVTAAMRPPSHEARAARPPRAASRRHCER